MLEHSSLERLLHRARAEYREMPGLRLTLPQAARLWALDRKTCAVVLDLLLNAGFLARTADGFYVRSDAEPRRRQRAREMLEAEQLDRIS